MPPPKQTSSVAIVATLRRPVSRSASPHTTRARTPAMSALETKNTGMIGRSAATAAIAPWKSANQW